MSSINNACYNKLFTMYYYDTESLFSCFALMFIVDYTLQTFKILYWVVLNDDLFPYLTPTESTTWTDCMCL